MNQYLLTAGETYYPQSGGGDWLASYHSLDDIPNITVIRASSRFSIDGFASYDWVEVVDTVNFQTVFSINGNSNYNIGDVIEVIKNVPDTILSFRLDGNWEGKGKFISKQYVNGTPTYCVQLVTPCKEYRIGMHIIIDDTELINE